VGVGYRASNQGQKLDLALGYSHNIVNGCFWSNSRNYIWKGKTIVKLTSFDKQL
jgi:large subunit ribosomal protein L6